MRSPIQIMDEIAEDAARLDALEKLLDTATDALNEAEERWYEDYDEMAEELKDQMVEEGRKGDPSEHSIVSATRKQNRLAWNNWRRAERAIKKIERQIGAKGKALNARQSELAALRAEARTDLPQPSWSHREEALTGG